MFFSIPSAPTDATCRLVAKLQPFAGMHHLDVAGGTGDVAFRVLRGMAAAAARDQADAEPVQDGASERRPGGVTVCDINPAMLEEGRRRAASEGHGERREPTCTGYRAAPVPLGMLCTARSRSVYSQWLSVRPHDKPGTAQSHDHGLGLSSSPRKGPAVLNTQVYTQGRA